jgi:hypothetical protein
MRRKDDTVAADFEDAFSPVPHASGVRTIRLWLRSTTCSAITWISIKHSCKEISYLAMASTARFIFPRQLDLRKTMD